MKKNTRNSPEGKISDSTRAALLAAAMLVPVSLDPEKIHPVEQKDEATHSLSVPFQLPGSVRTMVHDSEETFPVSIDTRQSRINTLLDMMQAYDLPISLKVDLIDKTTIRGTVSIFTHDRHYLHLPIEFQDGKDFIMLDGEQVAQGHIRECLLEKMRSVHTVMVSNGQGLSQAEEGTLVETPPKSGVQALQEQLSDSLFLGKNTAHSKFGAPLEISWNDVLHYSNSLPENERQAWLNAARNAEEFEDLVMPPYVDDLENDSFGTPMLQSKSRYLGIRRGDEMLLIGATHTIYRSDSVDVSMAYKNIYSFEPDFILIRERDGKLERYEIPRNRGDGKLEFRKTTLVYDSNDNRWKLKDADDFSPDDVEYRELMNMFAVP